MAGKELESTRHVHAALADRSLGLFWHVVGDRGGEPMVRFHSSGRLSRVSQLSKDSLSIPVAASYCISHSILRPSG